MKARGILFAVLLTAFGAIAYLFLDFANGIKSYSMENPADAEAIVVLTGGIGRVEEGLKLLRQTSSSVLILSGVHEDAGIESIFIRSGITGAEKQRVLLDKRSESTYGNAIEVRRLLRERVLSSIVLITSAYHAKRAFFVFRNVLPPGTKIILHSARTPNFDETRWWAGRGPLIVAVEFVKFYWYKARYSFTDVA